MIKRAILFTLLFVVVANIAYSQPGEYSQFIFKKSQKKLSYLQQFLNILQQRPFKGSYAIIIAIGNYDSLPHLESPKADTERMKKFLLDSAEYDEVVVLQNDEASFDNIRYFMQTYFPIKMDDGRYRFLFYFTGHGTQIQTHTGIMGYLQLKGATEKLSGDLIDMNQLEVWANQLVNAKHMLFLIDSCFSGLAGIEPKSGNNTKMNPLELAEESGRFMITAGGADEIAIGSIKEWGGSLFTDEAIKGMNGLADANKDGVVTTYELFNHIQATVKNEAKNSGRTQTPQIRD